LTNCGCKLIAEVGRLQLDYLTKVSRARQSPEETQAGVQVALNYVDHFAMDYQAKVNRRIANAPRPKQVCEVENRTSFCGWCLPRQVRINNRQLTR
jgi:hypothetical protein